jgi:hypothetical protein
MFKETFPNIIFLKLGKGWNSAYLWWFGYTPVSDWIQLFTSRALQFPKPSLFPNDIA